MLAALALDILDPPDRDRVLAHLQECEECTRAVTEYRLVTADLGLLAPSRDLDPDRSAALRARLVQRARDEIPRPAARVPALLAGPWIGWAVAAGLAGVVLVHHAVHRPLDYGWLVAGILMIVLVGLAWYASRQRERLRLMQTRLEAERGDAAPPVRRR